MDLDVYLILFTPGKKLKFTDEGAKSGHGEVIYFIRNDEAKNQYNWFQPQKGVGITKAGSGRLNASIEAFIYCIVGAQVNTRSSIAGNNDGSNQETEQEFLKLFENSVLLNNISESIQCYQLVIQEAKLRLNFAISPGTWLLPENLIINSEPIVGYNNNLKKVDESMVFGVNDINLENKQVGIAHNLGKLILPHTQNQKKKPQIKKEITPIKKAIKPHDLNKIILIISVTALGWFLFR